MPTVQRKTLAKGTKINIGPSGGTIAYFGRIEEAELPTEDFETVEAPELFPTDDSGASIDVDPVELGDEILGEFSFTHYYDPRHTDAVSLRTWRSGKTLLTFQFDTPHATGGARIVCSGRIKSLKPEKISKKNYFKQTVTIIRTTALTIADKPA